MLCLLRAGIVVSVILLLAGVRAHAASGPADPAATIGKIFAAAGLGDDCRRLYEEGLRDTRARNKTMPAEDFAFLEEKVRSFDYRAVLVKRWKVAFNAQEWAQIDAFVSGVGAKQLAAMSEIAHDMRGTNRGADFARLRMDTFANSLTARERKVLQEFHQGALGERFMRLLSRAGAETTEIVVAAFNDALKQTNDRRNALNASGWAKEVQAAKEAWAAKGVLDLRDLDVRPRGLLEGRPELPDELLSRDKRVVVVLDFTITSDGKTEDVVVVQSTDSRFDGPCIEAIRRWTFEPGTKDGRPVACRVRAPLAFEPTR